MNQLLQLAMLLCEFNMCEDAMKTGKEPIELPGDVTRNISTVVMKWFWNNTSKPSNPSYWALEKYAMPVMVKVSALVNIECLLILL